MATCPRCKGHLTENHRCPRSAARKAFEVSLAALGGGLVTLLIMALIDPHGQTSYDGVLLVGGALAGVGIGAGSEAESTVHSGQPRRQVRSGRSAIAELFL